MCTREGCPVIVLDDPVLSSDEEHSTTFGRYVVEALLGHGMQVIVSTHDPRLFGMLQGWYQHLPLDVFHITTQSPSSGAVVTKESDRLTSMLDNARPYLMNADDEIRKIGSGRLRDAAERLCKEIIVRNRRQNREDATIEEYEGKTLGELEKLVHPYLTKDKSHAGKMRVIRETLNPGSHDSRPAPPAALAAALGPKQAYVGWHESPQGGQVIGARRALSACQAIRCFARLSLFHAQFSFHNM